MTFFSLRKFRYDFLMILIDVYLFKDPDPGARKVPDPQHGLNIAVLYSGFLLGLGRISVLTDIRPPDSAFSSFNGYPLSVFFYGYPFSDFTTIRPDIRRIVRFLSRNNKKKSRDKTLIKLVIDDKMFNFLNFTISDFQ